MSDRSESDSRKLLRRLRDVLATPAKGQERLDRITHLIARGAVAPGGIKVIAAPPGIELLTIISGLVPLVFVGNEEHRSDPSIRVDEIPYDCCSLRDPLQAIGTVLCCG